MTKEEMRTPKSIIRMRQTPRGYPVTKLIAYDVDDPEFEGIVLDISEKGLQLAGIPIKLHQQKTLMIQIDKSWNVNPFSFDVECRWCNQENEDEPYVCGLEIINISQRDQEELLKVVERLSFLDKEAP
jgi:c-di-GMP-binding flagellar brake protein YcgR